MELGNCVDECCLVLHGGDAFEFGLDRVAAFRIGGFLVHAGTVEVADLLRDRVSSGRGDGGLVQDVSHRELVAFVQFDKADPRGLVGGNLGVLEPIAACILVEIGAGIDGFIDVVDAESLGSRALWSHCWRTLGSTNRKSNHNEKKKLKRTHWDLTNKVGSRITAWNL